MLRTTNARTSSRTATLWYSRGCAGIPSISQTVVEVVPSYRENLNSIRNKNAYDTRQTLLHQPKPVQKHNLCIKVFSNFDTDR